MTRNTTIALGVGVALLAGVGGYLVYRRRRDATGGYFNAGGQVPLYVPGGPDPFNPQGPPLSASGKLSGVQQQVTSAVQFAGDAAKNAVEGFEAGKKAWSDVKGFFA